MQIETTLQGLYYRRHEAEKFSQTAKTAKARAWWRQEAKETDRKIRARERLNELNKQRRDSNAQVNG